ncbi:MAG: hypothetical protein Q8R30_00095 [bacterium]|nr:hypothetical protein [bacterium]MDZ4285850.1 hypothetical protein [Candidatus Sungbacteria bacterium]
MRLEPDKKLHSREHVLAEDLSQMLGEPKNFAAYLGIAKRYYERDLRALARTVREKDDLPREAWGRYFFGCLRKLMPTSEYRAVQKLKDRKAAAKARAIKRKKEKEKEKKKNDSKNTANSKRASSRTA